MVLALILMLLFVNNISTVSTDTDVLTLVQDVIRQMCTSGTQILLFFPTILGGLSNGFLAGDFTLVIIPFYQLVGVLFYQNEKKHADKVTTTALNLA